MSVIDGAPTTNNEKNRKKNKKRDLRTITIKYSESLMLDDIDKKQDIMPKSFDEDNEEKDDDQYPKENINNNNIKTFSLIFDNKEKKNTWYQLLNNLIDEERAKYIDIQSKGTHSKKRNSGSMSSMKRYSISI